MILAALAIAAQAAPPPPPSFAGAHDAMLRQADERRIEGRFRCGGRSFAVAIVHRPGLDAAGRGSAPQLLALTIDGRAAVGAAALAARVAGLSQVGGVDVQCTRTGAQIGIDGWRAGGSRRLHLEAPIVDGVLGSVSERPAQ